MLCKINGVYILNRPTLLKCDHVNCPLPGDKTLPGKDAKQHFGLSNAWRRNGWAGEPAVLCIQCKDLSKQGHTLQLKDGRSQPLIKAWDQSKEQVKPGIKLYARCCARGVRTSKHDTNVLLCIRLHSVLFALHVPQFLSRLIAFHQFELFFIAYW
eukprot:COSAG02_NODE_926_length_15856_cov_13.975566_22_plen_155_part_00